MGFTGPDTTAIKGWCPTLYPSSYRTRWMGPCFQTWVWAGISVYIPSVINTSYTPWIKTNCFATSLNNGISDRIGWMDGTARSQRVPRSCDPNIEHAGVCTSNLPSAFYTPSLQCLPLMKIQMVPHLMMMELYQSEVKIRRYQKQCRKLLNYMRYMH